MNCHASLVMTSHMAKTWITELKMRITMGENSVDQGNQVPLSITRFYKITHDTPQAAVEILIALVVGKINIRYKGRKIFWNSQANCKINLKIIDVIVCKHCGLNIKHILPLKQFCRSTQYCT